MPRYFISYKYTTPKAMAGGYSGYGCATFVAELDMPIGGEIGFLIEAISKTFQDKPPDERACDIVPLFWKCLPDMPEMQKEE